MMFYSLIITITVICYVLFDVNYFLRSLMTISWGGIFWKRKRILEKARVYGICWTTDVDVFSWHMNNVRYLRELDFARSSFYGHTGIIREIKRSGSRVLHGATSIRYRRPITLFMPYKITTQLVFWDDCNLYLEHDFINLSDSFVHATAFSKQTITRFDIGVPDIIERLEPELVRPELTEELALWIDSMEASSYRLRQKRQDTSREMMEEMTSITSYPSTSESRKALLSPKLDDCEISISM